MYLSYPSIERDGIRIPKGLERGELPFRKEFLMARLLGDILKAEGRKVTKMVLLPRYTGRMLGDVFSVDVTHSSMEDALAVSLEDGEGAETTEYFEFKMCTMRNLATNLNNAMAASSRSLVVIDDFDKARMDAILRRGVLNPGGADHTAFIFSLDDGTLRVLGTGNKKRAGK